MEAAMQDYNRRVLQQIITVATVYGNMAETVCSNMNGNK
jgi:hypothetical protein